MNARRRLVLRVRDGHWLAALGLMLILILAGCTPLNTAAGNGDTTPQPGHTTHATPPAVAHADVIPKNQADIERLKALHPTAICAGNGALTWWPTRRGACTKAGEGGIGEWLGTVTA